MGLFNRATKNSDRDESGHGNVANRDRSVNAGWGIESKARKPEQPVTPEPEQSVAPEPAPTTEAAQPSTPEPGPRSEEEAPMIEQPNEPERPVTKADVAEELTKVEESDSTPDFKVTREPEPVEEPPRLTAQQALAPSRAPVVPGEDEGEDRSGRAKVISFANQKGGVAKTTTTLNLAVAFAEQGLRSLVIDLDPQGNLTMSQGIDPDKVEKSMYDVLVTHMPLSEVIQSREIDVAVSSIDLAGAEIAMSTQIGRERSLEKAIKGIWHEYDYICIDTPPSLGLLTINALTASDSVIVPVQCEYLSMRGLMQLQNTLEMIRDNLNPKVVIEGILPTMLDTRTVHAKEAVEILEENFGDLVFNSRIRKAIKFAEAPVRGSSVLKYDPKSNAADYYRDLAKEVLAKEIVTNGAS
ncbi:hypothetical protein BH10ACT11_BH10ACT11_07950 [soil metagenome]